MNRKNTQITILKGAECTIRSLLDEIKKQGYDAELTGGQCYDRAKHQNSSNNRGRHVPENNTLPLILMQQAFNPNTKNLVGQIEKTIQENGW